MASQGIFVHSNQSFELQRDPRGWNRELCQKWALAPKDLVASGVVTDENYEQESNKIGELGGGTLLRNLNGNLVMVLGIGRFREYYVVEQLNRKGVSITACDWSGVGCDIGRAVFDQVFYQHPDMPLGVYNHVYRVDIEMLFERLFSPVWPKSKTRAGRDLEKANLVYASQFVQVLDEIGKDIFMRGLGKWLASVAGRKAVLVHAFPEDNSGAEWGYTTPYSLEELLMPARIGAKRALTTSGLDNKGGFFNHIYTGFTIEAG